MTREQIMKRCEELDPIWQAMKEGKVFRFEDSSTGYIEDVCLWDSDKDYYYSHGMWYRHPKPIEPVRRVKDPVSLMKSLVDNKYWLECNGVWYHQELAPFNNLRFMDCGKLVAKASYEIWLPEWTEEVYE